MNPPDPVINVRIISLGGRRSRVLPTDSAGVEPRLGRGPTEVPTWFTQPSPFAGASTFVALIPPAVAKTTRFAVLMVSGHVSPAVR